MSERSESAWESKLKTLTLVLAVAGLLWGIWTYTDAKNTQLKQELADAKRTLETRRIEATRPYLDKQLELYLQATKAATMIATSNNPQDVEMAKRRFEELYFGELALVEHGSVASAMSEFRKALMKQEVQNELQPLALDLAHACRDELAIS
jgi:hypothetical protein